MRVLEQTDTETGPHEKILCAQAATTAFAYFFCVDTFYTLFGSLLLPPLFAATPR